MQRHTLLLLCFISIILFFSATHAVPTVTVGVVLDLDSWVGKVAKTAIELAADDVNRDTKLLNDTRLILAMYDSPHEDAIAGASAVLDAFKRQVVAIIGPQTSEVAEFVAHLGDAATVPIVSSATNPLLSIHRYPYFIRMAHNDSLQMQAIAAVVRAYGWRRIAVVHPDDDFGTGPLSSLIDALTNVGSEIEYTSAIPPNADAQAIREELYKLMTMQSRVFIAHMHSQLGSNLFIEAQKLGMMGTGYVWITTDEFTSLLEVLDASTLASMQGVLGVKSYIQNSNKLDAFTARWKKQFRHENPEEDKAELNQYGLFAYDSVWLIAQAIDNLLRSQPDMPNFNFTKYVSSNLPITTELANHLTVFREGPRLLKELLLTKFSGLSGPVQLRYGEIVGSTYEIVNVIGKSYNVAGYWTDGIGLCRKYNNTQIGSSTRDLNNIGAADLNPVIWPGGFTGVPSGWVTPTNGKKIKIGVPLKKGFDEFVRVSFGSSCNESKVTGFCTDVVETGSSCNEYKVTGFCIDVFETVLQKLEYALPYEFILHGVGIDNASDSYDDLVYQVFLENFDAAVGDITILANRSNYVDFTLPFTESGLVMVVPLVADGASNAWAFMQPFTPSMWCTTGAFFIFTGVVVWILEHKLNPDFRGTPMSQVVTLLWFSFSTLFFSHRERVVSGLGRLVIIVWLFVVLILTSSYTASLSSILTVQQMKPSIQDVDSLKASGAAVGYQEGSFVKEYLNKQLGIKKLIPYSTAEEYAKALSDGPNNGGVAAIFDEIPYIRVFLSGHCGYTIAGPTYKTGGFGFAFPKGSPLVSDISKAVLSLSESSEEMQGIEAKWLNETACNTPGAQVVSNRLSMKSFWGLYLISGLASVIALFIFLGRLCYDFGRDPSATAAQEIEMSQSKAVSISTRMKSFAKFADRREPADGSAYGEGSNTPTSLTIITTSSLQDLDESDDGSAAENRVSARSSSVSRCEDEQQGLGGDHIF